MSPSVREAGLWFWKRLSPGWRTKVTEPKVNPSLEEIARLLDDNGITWAVFAGMAAFAYGSSRVAALFPEAQVTRHKGVKVVHLPGFGVLAAGLPDMDLDEQMAARLTRHEIAGVIVPVIPPEDNILVKGLRGHGPEVGKHDWKDVREMMVHLPTLDWKYLYRRASTCGPREHVGQVLERLEALWRQVGKGPTGPKAFGSSVSTELDEVSGRGLSRTAKLR